MLSILFEVCLTTSRVVLLGVLQVQQLEAYMLRSKLIFSGKYKVFFCNCIVIKTVQDDMVIVGPASERSSGGTPGSPNLVAQEASLHLLLFFPGDRGTADEHFQYAETSVPAL